MNDATLPQPGGEPGLALLRALITDGDPAATAPSAAALADLRRRVAQWRAPDNRPPDLHGEACAVSAPDWHLQALLALADGQPAADAGAATTARRRYHARWLGHLLMPDEPTFRPCVTILIPVYNRAAMAAEAVESCLAQTWRPLEVLVVDDGSTDDLAGALARFGDEVRMLRKENGGVSSARNLGIGAARGELIHFLDSDNLLLPLSVARKVDGFARIPDAECCYNRAELRGRRSHGLRSKRVKAASTSPIPTVDPQYPAALMLGTDPRTGFYVSCVMVPRFTLLEAEPFDEDVRRSEDTLYWLRLALRGTKAIRIETQLAIRRLLPDSLAAKPRPVWLNVFFTARVARLCLAHPRHWPVAANGIAHVRATLMDQATLAITPASRTEVMRLAEALGTVQGTDTMTALPVLAHCRHVLASRLDGVGADQLALLQAMHAAARAAALRAAPLTAADLAHWRRTAVTNSGNGRLNAFCAYAEKVVARSPTALPLIDELLRHAGAIPKRHAIRRYVRLRRLGVPRSLALWLCR